MNEKDPFTDSWVCEKIYIDERHPLVSFNWNEYKLLFNY